MRAIDTNVLVRFLVQDDEKQTQVSTQLLTDAEADKQPLFVSNVVVLELMWVLRSIYEVPRDEILVCLNNLLSMMALEFQDSLIVHDFVSSAQNNTYDLADLLISQVAKGKGCDTTLTFDKKAAKAPHFTPL
ncbi:type II toxin-antitoxin system VapC family toxin [Candidatus Thiothrix sp. Deng01]|uniref:Type II toxin-antitoxin system VapC family toxin n=1 Tax=Candidatus Thiothrix phosphatis TaxID=3112415 RepID=A0ABU6D195_9GAMM|nr:type II toxin-antitoxin system VapC family toxin [Candidatus Thiothrix sp. Deng01]MEB4592611.1 type II toxin-antitoxin system VapC family toxin [Candidatus Thiothrix sp. Deng01]